MGIWKGDFNCLISRKGDFSHINASIDATEVALPKENAIWKAEGRKQRAEGREAGAVPLGLFVWLVMRLQSHLKQRARASQ